LIAKPIVHFAHANGFPASSYRKLFCELEPTNEIVALEKFGHNPEYPISQDWKLQIDELVDHIDKYTREPVYAVGHSFGAVVSYMAVCKYPERFKGLIMLDPPIFTGLTSLFVKSIRKTSMFDKLTPAKKTLSRCVEWPLETDLVNYFSRRALFKNMHKQCIEDYVTSAIKRDNEKFKLDFDREIEAQIFRTIPLNISSYYGKLTKPALLISGEKTEVCLPRLINPFVKGNKMEHQILKGGGHMFPLEQPTLVGQGIARQVSEWEESSKC